MNKDINFIVASGKTGTTWVTEMLGYNSNIIFEPFGTKSDYYHIAFTDNFNQFKNVISETILGENTKWVFRLQKLTAPNIMIKFIRQPFLIDEILDFYKCKMIYVYRNPLFVINSQYKQNWNSDLFFKIFLNNYYLCEKLNKHIQFIINERESKSRFKDLVLRFCVENYFIQNSKSYKEDKIKLLSYETINYNYKNIILYFKYLNIPVPKNLKYLAKKRSITSSKKSNNKPKKDLTLSQCKYIRMCLNKFKLPLVI